MGTLTITIHQCAAIGIGSMLGSILSSMTQNYIAEEPTETVMNPVDTQYQKQFSERHGHHSHTSRDVFASPKQDSSDLATFIVPIGLIKFLFHNMGGIILWLSILLTNFNLTNRIQNLSSELEETKSSLLSKLESNSGLIEELSNNISSVWDIDNEILGTQVDCDHHDDCHHHHATSIVESGTSSFTDDVLGTYVDDLEDNSLSDDINHTQSQLEDEASFLESMLDELVKIRTDD